MVLVWLGLVLYDAYARDPTLPKHRLHRVVDARAAGDRAAGSNPPPVNPAEYRWLASYYDAQVTYPERLTLALLSDACAAAAEHGQSVQVFTYHQARLDGRRVVISPVGGESPELEIAEPAAVINATGAWVDETLRRLAVPCERLMGGTKGSHFITAHAGLAAALAGRAIYAEARDGRPVFILPWAGQTLVGTTDETYSGDPGAAVASREELNYLVDAVRQVFPQFPLTDSDIALSYAGIRPLPHSDAQTTAAISREHFFKRHSGTSLPLYSIVGGKLTTCRALAEQTAGTLLADLGRPRLADSRERVIPGGEGWPASPAAEAAARREIASRSGLPLQAVEQAWQLVGTRASEILCEDEKSEGCIRDTDMPLALARWSIRHAWATRLDDLVRAAFDARLSAADPAGAGTSGPGFGRRKSSGRGRRRERNLAYHRPARAALRQTGLLNVRACATSRPPRGSKRSGCTPPAPSGGRYQPPSPRSSRFAPRRRLSDLESPAAGLVSRGHGSAKAAPVAACSPRTSETM